MTLRKIQIELKAYSAPELIQQLSNQFTSVDYIRKKRQLKYLINYFAGGNQKLIPKTIVIETGYTSRSFLYDYSRFYSLCFQDNYKPSNKRIHFFSTEFSSYNIDQFLAEIENKESEILSNDNYLGYVVVKNLPKFVFGPCLLRPYQKDLEQKRNFPVTKNYNIHLVGRTYKLETLVFQEQDTIVSACSTVSLWIAFHKTSELFNTKLPTPSEITLKAKNFSGNFPSRTYPSLGFDLNQIVTVIDSVGLDFELINDDSYWSDFNRIKSFVYAYIYSGIPVLLGLDVNQEKHLVTIVGYSDNDGSIYDKIKSPRKPRLKSDSIKHFYIHCDQTGAFARLNIDRFEKKVVLSLDHHKEDFQKGNVVSLIVPLYQKIRIKFDDIYEQIIIINRLFKKLVIISQRRELSWDIFLIESEKYKQKEFPKIDEFYERMRGTVRKHVMLAELPRFIWVARFIHKDFVLIDLIYDTTDIANGFYCLNTFAYNNDFKNMVLEEFEQNNSFSDALSELNSEYPNLIKESLSLQI